MIYPPIFKKTDFSLCEVPAPAGYPQSQTHAGVFYISSGLGGYQYWLVSTPFPSIRESKIKSYSKAIIRKLFFLPNPKSAERYENPLLYYANNKKDNSPPTIFYPYKFNPLIDVPADYGGGGAYNSDPDILILNRNIYILVRRVVRNYNIFPQNEGKPRTSICLLSGEIKNNNFSIVESKVILYEDSVSLISPSLIYYKDKFRLFTLDTNSYNDGKACRGMYVFSSKNMMFRTKRKIHVEKGNFEPWHLSLFQHNDELYSIVTCVKRGEKGYCYQMLGKFNNDITTLKIYQRPLTTLNSYRGSAIVREDGLFVLYTTVVGEKFKGSSSVDGRDIIMTSIDFDELIRELKL